MNQTTQARQLLDLLFEGQPLRYALGADGRPLFVAKDVFRAGGIRKYRDAQKRLDPDEMVSSVVDTIYREKYTRKTTVQTLTESGVYHVLFGSRKPEAVRLRRLLTEEVMPQIVKYGTYLPGATPAERLKAASDRIRIERAREKQEQLAALGESGLLTIPMARAELGILARDALPFYHALAHEARKLGHEPRRFWLGGTRAQTAWPRALLNAALFRFQPKLPFHG